MLRISSAARYLAVRVQRHRSAEAGVPVDRARATDGELLDDAEEQSESMPYSRCVFAYVCYEEALRLLREIVAACENGVLMTQPSTSVVS